MAKRLMVFAVMLALIGAPSAAFAASPWASEADWASQSKSKFVYGVKNTLLGWTEIFTEPHNAIAAGSNFFTGIAEGLWNGVGQTIGGALHLATFFIPQVDVPLPEGGTQLFQ